MYVLRPSYTLKNTAFQKVGLFLPLLERMKVSPRYIYTDLGCQ
jgi:hypothetical protein